MCFNYVIRQGDSLYNLAGYYKTTVDMLIRQNPHVNPNNLQIGSTVTICPGMGYNSYPEAEPASKSEWNLTADMRSLWEQHVFWTRLVLVSIANKLNDQMATVNRLLQNPKDIANVYAKYYPADVARNIENLLTQHLQIGGDIITAARDGQTAKVNDLSKQWYANADQIANYFSSINPFYDKEEVRNMFYTHLDLTTQEVQQQLAGNFSDSIKTFDKIEKEALEMANYFTQGLVKQIPQKIR